LATFWLCHINGLIEGNFSSAADARDYLCELALEDGWGPSAFDLNIIETAETYEPEAKFLEFAAITADWLPLSDGEVERVPRRRAVS
jgi:hypothetical protein